MAVLGAAALRYLEGTVLGSSPLRALLALCLSLIPAYLQGQSVVPAEDGTPAQTIYSGLTNSELQTREFKRVTPAREGQVNLGTLDLYRFGQPTTGTSSAIAQLSVEYARRKAKAVLAIQQVFGSPAVLAVQEVKDLATLNDLASAASHADTLYRAYLESNNPDGLNLGFLVSSAAADVLRVEEMQKGETYWLLPDASSPHPVWQHPPLVLHLSLRSKGGAPATPLTLINVHLSPPHEPSDPQLDEGFRAQRQHQAASLAALIQSYERVGEQIIVLGNFNTPENAREFPGVLSTIMGSPKADGLPALGPAVTPALTDETATLPAEERYNAFTHGQPVALERILISSGLHATAQQPHFTAGSDVTLAEIDGTPAGLGPYDGQFITFALPTAARLATKSNAFDGGFGNQVIGTISAPQHITLIADSTNTLPITFKTATITGANASDFTVISNTCISLAPSASCAMTLTFTPSAIGTRSAVLSAPNDSNDKPNFTVPLSGTGVSPLQASPASLNFGNIDVTARSAAQSVLITNISTHTVALGRTSIKGDYIGSSDCGTTLLPKASCTATILFMPTAVGVRDGTLTLGDGSLGGGVPLTGNGVDFSVAITPDSDGTIAGKSVFPSATLTPTPGFGNTISLTCSSNAVASYCQPGQIGGPLTATAQVSLQIDTTAKYIIVGFGGSATTRGLALLAFGSSMLLVCTRRRRPLTHLLALAFLLSLPALLSGCGNRQPPQNTPYTAPGTYTYTVTATDGILTHTAAYSLQVKAF